jgi:hypothetical protein
MRRSNAEWPETLVDVPEKDWPPARPGYPRPVRLWRSRHFLVQLYTEGGIEYGVDGIECQRLTINRTTLDAEGNWDADISWDELQLCKRQAGFGDVYAVEVFPWDRDIVYDANMRHLWLLSKPLPIGWFAGG